MLQNLNLKQYPFMCLPRFLSFTQPYTRQHLPPSLPPNHPFLSASQTTPFPAASTHTPQVNEAREFTKQFTRRYLEDQLVMELAGMAAEKVVYGADEISTLNQRRIANGELARGRRCV